MEEPRIFLVDNARNRRRALAFIRYHVKRRYGGVPLPSKIIMMAEINNRICGTISLDPPGIDGRFPLEVVYDFDYSKTPRRFNREEFVQFGRWWTTRPGIAVRLMFLIHLHALSLGKRFGLVEVKSHILKHVEGFGMSLAEVSGASLQIKAASSRKEGYYSELPPPKLYMFDIDSNAKALARHLGLG